MHKGFFRTEIISGGRLHGGADDVQVVWQVRADFLLSCLPDVANGLNHFLISPLYVPRVGVVNLEAHVLDRVTLPGAHLILADE